MKKLIPIFLLLTLFSSCVSKLKVTVASADREVVLKEAEKYVKEDVVRGITALENFYYNWDEDPILEQIYLFLAEKNKPYLIKDSFKDNYKIEFNKNFNNKLENLKKLTSEAEKCYESNNNYKALANINLAGKVIFEIQAVLKEYEIELNEGSIKKIKIEPKIVTQTSTAISGTSRTKFPILGDPMVSFLTKEENKAIWKSRYNKTASSNFFGNADIAVILRTNPPENEIKSGDYNNNFTLKGVRLDAKDSSIALLTGLTQTLNFVANTQGIPLKIGQQQDANFPAPEQNVLVTGLDNDKNTLETKKKKLTDYKKMLVEKILSEKIDTKKDAELTAAVLRIENFWITLKTELTK